MHAPRLNITLSGKGCMIQHCSLKHRTRLTRHPSLAYGTETLFQCPTSATGLFAAGGERRSVHACNSLTLSPFPLQITSNILLISNKVRDQRQLFDTGEPAVLD